jgi:hypothetical protein
MAPHTVDPTGAFTASCGYDGAYPDALAVYCSDGRFTEAVEELLRELGHARLDTLTMPGGPGLLNLWSTGLAEHAVASNAARFLVEKHGIVKAVLLAHEGCGYYRWLCPTASPTRIRARQLDDLHAARGFLADTHPGLAVETFYANASGDRVSFERVAAEGALGCVRK